MPIVHSPPQTFSHNIVTGVPSTVYTDSNVIVAQNLGECLTAELAVLVGVENHWTAIESKVFFKRFDTKLCIQHVGNVPCQDFAAIPIYNGYLFLLICQAFVLGMTQTLYHCPNLGVQPPPYGQKGDQRLNHRNSYQIRLFIKPISPNCYSSLCNFYQT